MESVWYDPSLLWMHAQVSKVLYRDIPPLTNQSQEQCTRHVTLTMNEVQTSDWQLSDGFTLGREVLVEAQVPCVLITGLELSKKNIFNDISWTDTIEKTTVSLTAPPLTKIHFTLKYFQVVTTHLPFRAVLNCVLDNGFTFKMDVKGLYSGVSNSDVFVDSSRTVANWNGNAKSWDKI